MFVMIFDLRNFYGQCAGSICDVKMYIVAREDNAINLNNAMSKRE
jgi:hypothetical protein